MSPIAALLIIFSAFTHAAWNAFSKKQHPTLGFFALANIIGVACMLPLLGCFISKISLVPLSVWICAISSGFFLTSYMAALAKAYRSGDVSLAYPLARALPVIIITVVTLFLGRGQDMGWWFMIGIGLVVSGCLVLPLKTLGNFSLQNYRNLCCLMACLAAVGISGYTMVDDLALRILRTLPGSPFSPLEATGVYILLEASIMLLWMLAFICFRPRDRKHFWHTVRHGKQAAAITGVGIYVTYGLVLTSMNFVTNVSYVAAFRQLSIPIGAILGITLLREPCFRPKAAGVVMIFIGLIMVGTG
jgi:drug/metabolite transporter (DMT)-like permease